MAGVVFDARARNLRISAFKMRPIANLIRGCSYPQALAMLEVMPNKGAKMLLVLIRSAASNMLRKHVQLSEEQLFVNVVCVDEATTYKRIWRRGRGRADQRLLRSSHASVALGRKDA